MPDPNVPNTPSAGHQPEGDPLFTLGLVYDVAEVLEAHGYERLNGGQLIELQQHMFFLLHGDPAGTCTGGVG